MNQNHRQLAANLIDAFLSARVDESHHEIYNQIRKSKDDTVRFACEIVEELVDAYEDEPNLMDKEEWDHLERIRLVLLSGRNLTCKGKFVFEPAQVIAVVMLFLYAITLVCFGIGWYLVPVHAISAVVGLVLSRLIESKQRKQPFQHLIYPFTSYTQLATAYSEAVGFSKKRMPRDAQLHRKSAWFDIVLTFVVLLPMAPVFLFVIGAEGGTEYRVSSA